jgi:hypothetical protein
LLRLKEMSVSDIRTCIVPPCLGTFSISINHHFLFASQVKQEQKFTVTLANVFDEFDYRLLREMCPFKFKRHQLQLVELKFKILG